MVSRSAHATRTPAVGAGFRPAAAAAFSRLWAFWGPGEPGDGPVPGRIAARRVVVLALAAALAGVAVAGLLLPAVSAVGLTGKASADHFMSLPANFTPPPLATDSRIVAADGSTIAVLHGNTDRTAVTLKQIPKIMQQAIVAIEDSRFYDHSGVDVRGLLRAAVRNSSSGSVQQGGSTITQQYVKNALLSEATTAKERQDAAGDSVDRKLRELRYAAELEKKWSKQEILERYLNIAYFGQGAYGVGTASQRYFRVPISKVNVAQAAMLAGMVQSPTAYDPFQHPQAAKARRDTVLDRMAQLKVISPAEATFAKRTPLGISKTVQQPAADSCQPSGDAFFCDYVRNELLADPALGATKQDREQRLDEGGLTIRTTLDPKIQNAAQQAVDNTVDPSNPFDAVAVSVQPGTGNIVAMAVNHRYGSGPGRTKVPLATTAALQPGSTFKMFTLAAALQDGYGVNTHFNAPACYVSRIYTIDSNSGRAAGGACPTGFSNDDPAEAGVYDLRKATADSVNTYYIQLEEKVSVPGVEAMAEKLGIPAARFNQPNNAVGYTSGALTLGAWVVSPLEMADAYSTIAAHGIRCQPRSLANVVDANRHIIMGAAQKPSCQRVINSGLADTVANILGSVITSGTGNPNAQIGRPAAGKTGTVEGFKAAWFVGFTQQLASAVEIGFTSGPDKHRLENVTADGRTWSPGVYGGDLPAIAWARLMRAGLADKPPLALPAMNPIIAKGNKPDPYTPPKPKRKAPPKKGKPPRRTPITQPVQPVQPVQPQPQPTFPGIPIPLPPGVG